MSHCIWQQIPIFVRKDNWEKGVFLQMNSLAESKKIHQDPDGNKNESFFWNIKPTKMN